MVKENVVFQEVSGVGYGKGIMILLYVKDPSVARVLDGKYVADILKNKVGFGGKLIDYKMERVEPYSKLTSFKGYLRYKTIFCNILALNFLFVELFLMPYLVYASLSPPWKSQLRSTVRF